MVGPHQAHQRTAATEIDLPGREVTAVAAVAEPGRYAEGGGYNAYQVLLIPTDKARGPR